ncbi:hypothetical protein [Glutamicibacter sp.]|jgi:hypothetical protein|uniref:hypothetical protein n=1 Tax=Glutamicibacter sp. TaxID=1931995 RepID=UPI002B483C6E|nr:hypothetical protein [Glutamicibacter sp.]HJX78925.1 hypothetical protein [Glutamicibacter sp.]
MSTLENSPDKQEQEAELAADLEQIWQEESPDTAKTTKFADEVDGELGTREGA